MERRLFLLKINSICGNFLNMSSFQTLILADVFFGLFFLGRIIATKIWGLGNMSPNSFKQVVQKEGMIALSVVVVMLQHFGLQRTCGIPDIVRILSTAPVLFGILVCLWVRFVRKETWGRFGKSPEDKKHELCTKGPYQFSRHPYYVGLFAIFGGLSIMYNNLPLILVFLLWVIIALRVAKKEDDDLARIYGLDWSNYRKKVRFIL